MNGDVLMQDYEFGRHIGKGGMADVYLGFQRGLGGFEKLVVLKKIRPDFAQKKFFVDLFLSEARTSALIQHPNVVQTYDIRHESDKLVIAMEYIHGLTLDEILNKLDGPLPVAIALRVVSDIASGLHAAHTQKDSEGALSPIVHLDLTPSNLIVSKNGITKILDYGIVMAATTTQNAQFLGGKPGYIPPEYYHEGIIDPRGDVFQLGIVLHELLSGKRLINAATPTQQFDSSSLEEDILPISSIRDGVSTELDALISSCLEPVLKNRPKSALELRKSLLSYLKKIHYPTQEDVSGWLKNNFEESLTKKEMVERRVRRESNAPKGKNFRARRGTEENPAPIEATRNMRGGSDHDKILPSLPVTSASKLFPKKSVGFGILVASSALIFGLFAFRQGLSVNLVGVSGDIDFDPITEETTSPVEIWVIEDQAIRAISDPE